MSNSSDDKLLDEYLSGSTPYSSRYRRVESDEVPLELDRAVLEQARASIAKRRSQVWWRVGPTLAIAATAIFTVSVVMRTGNDALDVLKKSKDGNVFVAKTDQMPMTPSEADKQAPAAPAAIQSNNEEQLRSRLKEKSASLDKPAELARDGIEANAATQQKLADSGKDLREAEASRQEKKSEPQQPAFAPPPPVNRKEEVALSTSAYTSAPNSPAIAAQSGVVSSSNGGNVTRLAERRSGTSVPPAAPSKQETARVDEVTVTAQRIESTPQDSALPVDVISSQDLEQRGMSRIGTATDGVDRHKPASWIKYIRKLRAEGKQEEADEEWKAFVAAFPNYSVSSRDAARPKK